MDRVRADLLAATLRFLPELGLTKDDHPTAVADAQDRFGQPSWIVFGKADNSGNAAVAGPAVDVASASSAAAPAVVALRFDEATGQALQKQVSFDAAPETAVAARKHTTILLPWREWHGQSRDMSHKDADMAAALLALDGIHSQSDATMVKVETLQVGSKTVVVASEDIPGKHQLALPPCIPRQGKLQQTKSHPYAVVVNVTTTTPVARILTKGAQDQPQRVLRENDFVLHPEWKAPTIHRGLWQKTTEDAAQKQLQKSHRGSERAVCRSRGCSGS